MNNITKFRDTDTVLSKINYHLVLSTRYRRKVFLDEELRQKARELIIDKLMDMCVTIFSIEIGDFYIILRVECPPYLSVQQLVSSIKRVVSVKELKDAFPALKNIPHLWIKGYMVSTDIIDYDTIIDYVFSQKKRYK